MISLLYHVRGTGVWVWAYCIVVRPGAVPDSPVLDQVTRYL